MKWLIKCIILLCAVTNAQAQKLSLDSVLKLVEIQNPLLQQYYLKANALDEFAKGSGAWMAPMVGVGNFMSAYPGAKIMDERDRGSFMISAEQEFLNPVKTKQKRKYNQSLSDVQRLAAKENYNTLRYKAKQLYFEIVVLNKKQHFLLNSEKNMKLMKSLADIRYSYDGGSLPSIYKAEASLAESLNMIQMNEVAIKSKKVLLNMLMNREEQTPFDVDSVLPALTFNNFYDTLELAGVKSDIKRMDAEIASMQLNVKLMQADALPDFKIRYEHMNSYSAHMPNQYTAMAMVSVPIAPWSSKMYKSQVSGMQMEITAMKKQREAMLIEARGMIISMQQELSNMQLLLNNYEKRIIPALTKSFEASLIAYQENRLELPQVTDAWESLNMTQIKFLDLWQQYLNMITDYEKELDK